MRLWQTLRAGVPKLTLLKARGRSYNSQTVELVDEQKNTSLLRDSPATNFGDLFLFPAYKIHPWDAGEASPSVSTVSLGKCKWKCVLIVIFPRLPKLHTLTSRRLDGMFACGELKDNQLFIEGS